MINYESGRAYSLSSISQEILHSPELFTQWIDNLIIALKQPIEPPKPAGNHVVIYTDGACSGNPGPGGWGSVLMFGGRYKEFSGASVHTTNNRMELYAAISALSALKRPCVVTLYSDSAYLVNAFNRSWINGWQKNDWKNSQNHEVENRDLWEELVKLTSEHTVTFVKVKGHSDNEWNNRCDQLAVAAYKALMQEEAA